MGRNRILSTVSDPNDWRGAGTYFRGVNTRVQRIPCAWDRTDRVDRFILTRRAGYGSGGCMPLPWKKKAPPVSQPKSLAEVAAEKAKMLRGWLEEIEEMEGGDPEEQDDVAARFVMRLKNFIQQTDDLLDGYDHRVAHHFANAIGNERLSLTERMEHGARYLEVVAADENYKATFPAPRPPPPPKPTVLVQGWGPLRVLGACGATAALVITTLGAFAPAVLIEQGKQLGRLEMQREAEKADEALRTAREERDKCLAKLNAPSSRAPAPAPKPKP